MIDKLWELLKKTGDVRIFNIISRREGKNNGSNKSRRDSSRRN